MASPQRNHAIVRSLLVCLLAAVVQNNRAFAHAGHAALPTKGTQVDVKQGTVFLSREAREALAAKTAEVELQEVKKSILAFATLESPWKKHAFATSRVGGRIERLFVKPGQSVKAGQPLAEVRSLELENLQLELLNSENSAFVAAGFEHSIANLYLVLPQKKSFQPRQYDLGTRRWNTKRMRSYRFRPSDRQVAA